MTTRRSAPHIKCVRYCAPHRSLSAICYLGPHTFHPRGLLAHAAQLQ